MGMSSPSPIPVTTRPQTMPRLAVTVLGIMPRQLQDLLKFVSLDDWIIPSPSLAFLTNPPAAPVTVIVGEDGSEETGDGAEGGDSPHALTCAARSMGRYWPDRGAAARR